MSPTYRVFGALAVKSRRIRSGTGTGTGTGAVSGAGIVVRTGLRRCTPTIPCSHHPLDPLVIDLDPGIAQLRGHPRGTVGAVGVCMDGADPRRQLLIDADAFRPGRRRGPPPVKTRAGDFEDLAQPLHRNGVAVVVNDWKRLTNSSLPRNTLPPCAESPARFELPNLGLELPVLFL